LPNPQFSIQRKKERKKAQKGDRKKGTDLFSTWMEYWQNHDNRRQEENDPKLLYVPNICLRDLIYFLWLLQTSAEYYNLNNGWISWKADD